MVPTFGGHVLPVDWLKGGWELEDAAPNDPNSTRSESESEQHSHTTQCYHVALVLCDGEAKTQWGFRSVDSLVQAQTELASEPIPCSQCGAQETKTVVVFCISTSYDASQDTVSANASNKLKGAMQRKFSESIDVDEAFRDNAKQNSDVVDESDLDRSFCNEVSGGDLCDTLMVCNTEGLSCATSAIPDGAMCRFFVIAHGKTTGEVFGQGCGEVSANSIDSAFGSKRRKGACSVDVLSCYGGSPSGFAQQLSSLWSDSTVSGYSGKMLRDWQGHDVTVDQSNWKTYKNGVNSDRLYPDRRKYREYGQYKREKHNSKVSVPLRESSQDTQQVLRHGNIETCWWL